ncbi:hypothetical protein SLEP1_g45037 [Rubroshorea leprosula]|uniref:Uncharacterized protein n=1 Tax=Rubroshorea leprosula TaxID=152421 RepID=A0AAV5LI44_9ROSI|nr:hypothetical protein SLEP1_g45037 [Rubroshorea leprosula]
MAACGFHSNDGQNCPANCIFRGIFPQSDGHVQEVSKFFKLENLIDFAKNLSGVERDEDLVPTQGINGFLWEIHEFVQDITTRSGRPYARIEAVLENLRKARSYLPGKPALADALVDISIQILDKKMEVPNCLALVEEFNLALEKEAAEQEEAAEKELAAKEATEKEVEAKEVAEQEVAAKEAAEQEVEPKEAAEQEVAAEEAAEQEVAAEEEAEQEAAAKEAAEQEAAAKEATDQEVAAEERAGKKSDD